MEPINTIITWLALSQQHYLEKARMAVQDEYEVLPANINKAMSTLLQGSNFSSVTNTDFFALLDMYFWLCKLPLVLWFFSDPYKSFSMLTLRFGGLQTSCTHLSKNFSSQLLNVLKHVGGKTSF